MAQAEDSKVIIDFHTLVMQSRPYTLDNVKQQIQEYCEKHTTSIVHDLTSKKYHLLSMDIQNPINILDYKGRETLAMWCVTAYNMKLLPLICPSSGSLWAFCLMGHESPLILSKDEYMTHTVNGWLVASKPQKKRKPKDSKGEKKEKKLKKPNTKKKKKPKKTNKESSSVSKDEHVA